MLVPWRKNAQRSSRWGSCFASSEQLVRMTQEEGF